LSRYVTTDVGDSIVHAASRDSSLLVLCAGIRTLAAIDSIRGFDLAARYVGMKSYRNIVRRTALDVMMDGHDPRSVPFALTYSATDNPADIRRLSVRILGGFSSTSPEAKSRLIALVNDGVVSIRKAAVEGLAMCGDRDVAADLRRREAIENDDGVRKAIDQAMEAIAGGSNPGPPHAK
jgi:HEAT repeat protein